jgi:hypothetical protein
MKNEEGAEMKRPKSKRQAPEKHQIPSTKPQRRKPPARKQRAHSLF